MSFFKLKTKKHYHVVVESPNINVTPNVFGDECSAESAWYSMIETVHNVTGLIVGRWDGRIARFDDNRTVVKWFACDRQCLLSDDKIMPGC